MSQCFVQVTGPFTTSDDIVATLKSKYSFMKVLKVGIQARTGHKCKINNQEIVEIGKTGIYEINNVNVNSIIFLQEENDSTIIDFVVE